MAQVINDSPATLVSGHATDFAGNELFDFTSGGATQTYLGRNDHGDVTWTSGTTGAVTARAAYDPFGNLVASSGTIPPSRWQGSWQDTVTGLYYVIARWYAPSSGRFLSDDPLAGDVTRPQTRDPYAYGAGDSIDASDPDGRCIVEDGVRIGCGGGASANAAALRRIVQASARLLRAEETAWRRSVAKYNAVLKFMVESMKAHAAGFTLSTDYGGGRLDFARNSTLTLAVFGTLFSAYPCGPNNPFNIGPAGSWARRNCGAWDDKWVLKQVGAFKSESKARNWTALPDTGVRRQMISYIIWGNIDFAFTGRAWGIPQPMLENYGSLLPTGTAGTLAQANVPPQKTGYRLWDMLPGHDWNNLTAEMLDKAIHKDAQLSYVTGFNGELVRDFSSSIVAGQ